ncbi:uncharacterized protein UV8b_08147 [Ustilaginoidea virens]|uniref:Involucrin repeat protein n=1 Tax=Ustilaginoidea virens TaxID=1159556 RepID=A0A8E5HYK6_USTVR|nr:uncharacterized protein UV8b_08147 [Ustilaginoidea virens]QUC23906.1 hypothetical protein UV8b_08147 [Ustilaginoidea virens]
MNSYPTGRAPHDYGVSSLSPPASTSSSKADSAAMNGYSQDAPSLDQTLGPTSTPRSARVELKDPIQIHLLTETALSDSRGYEILSQEEVDELKKQEALLSQRVESTRSNLAIQSKYRDASASMARLGQGAADHERIKEAERERLACGKRCDELAQELLSLEKRLLVPRRKILEHTAAILQLTHKASRRKAPPQNGQLINGVPGSPESLYTYSHGRNSLEQVGDDNYYFGDPSVYQLDGLERSRKNAIEIPLKSPIREQNQLRVELDRLREENSHLRSQTDGLLGKLQGLNMSLRDTIVRFNPEVNRGYDEPPRVTLTPDATVANLLESQVEYLESGLVAVQAEQDSYAGGSGGGGGGGDGGSQLGERIEAINLQLRDLLMSSNPHYTPTMLPSDSDVDGQMTYLEDSIRSIDSQLARIGSSSATDETGPVLSGLWDSMRRGFAEAKQRKDDRRRARLEKGLPEDDEDMSDSEGFDATEPYSLESFANKVRWMQSQAITLRDQKYVLKRQIKQQRELNNKSDAEKDEELAHKQEELEQHRQLLSRADKDAAEARKMLSETMADLEEARKARGGGPPGAAQAAVEQRNVRIAELEGRLEAAQDSLAGAESRSQSAERRLADVGAQVESLAQEKQTAVEAARGLQKQLAGAETRSKEAESTLAKVHAQMDSLTQDRRAAVEAAQELKKQLAAAESRSKETESQLAKVNAQIDSLRQDRRAASEAAEDSKRELAAQTKQFKVKEDEVEQLNMTIAELKTEVTIARAELDGAYGSRAERAAEVAAIKQSAEVLKLQNQVDRLKKELGATVEELEGVTKETIGSEKEKADIEARLDEALTAKARLDAELRRARDETAKLQEELDGERLRVPGEACRPGAGASVLSERFRATMRAERKKFQEDLREERLRCRRVEEELARLKRGQGGSRGMLSPR